TINGSVVSTTAEHPFMVHGRGWQMAGNLRPGDVLITPDGTTVLEAVDVEERDLADIENVYNFHVENNHNYYVHAGDTPVLVHNSHGGADDATEIVSKKADKWFDTQDDARNAVLDAHGVSDKSLVDSYTMYGPNPNLKGPQGQPWEQLEAIDDSGRLVQIEHHSNGHFFKDTNEYALPHYHGPEGHYFYGNERIW
ncbi:Hint domain-containing protein, partial [Promicromonospora umidemergens]